MRIHSDERKARDGALQETNETEDRRTQPTTYPALPFPPCLTVDVCVVDKTAWGLLGRVDRPGRGTIFCCR